MKKVFKSRIFMIVLTTIICITGTAYATGQILASDIEYTKNGVKTNVESALNDLYDKASNLGDILYINTKYDDVQPTTINADLSNYQSVVIIGTYNKDALYSNYIGFTKINVNSSGRLEVEFSKGDSTKRDFIVNNNSIEIKEGYTWDNRVGNGSAVPRYIIGIRKTN